MRRHREDLGSLYWEGPDGPGNVLVRVEPGAFRRFDRRIDRQVAQLVDLFARQTPPSIELLEACLGGYKP